jgi:hypothetical protein
MIYLLMLMVVLNPSSESRKVVTLNDLQWKHRIIITLSNDPEMSDSLRQQLQDRTSEIDDRDIIFFLISPASVISNSEYLLSLEDQADLIRDYYRNPEQLKVLLIGKDGGVKMEADKFDLDSIFRLIDSMPMRQREMREN